MAAALQRLNTDAVRQRCRAVAARFAGRDGLLLAADAIEQFAAERVLRE
jgi:hypothetical protein